MQKSTYPFGSLVPNRHATDGSYRYGFNGMEKDDEVKGEGNSYDFGARMLDPRVGRWFSPDSHETEFPDSSTYSYADNNPLYNSDINGDYPNPRIYAAVIKYAPLAPLYDKSVFLYFENYVRLRKIKNRTPQQEKQLISYHGNLKGAIGETIGASSFTIGLLPFFRAVAKPSSPGKKYDAVITVNPIKSMIDKAKKGVKFIGPDGGYIRIYQDDLGIELNDINGKEYLKKISLTSETKIYAEIKTVGSGRSAKDKILKGLDQAIETAKERKSNNEITVLVTDKDTFLEITKNSNTKSAIDEKLRILQSLGGGLILRDNQNENTEAIIDNMTEQYEKSGK
ncbi:MAG: hypothetical protein J0L86_05010 [Flavobacteriales bacterium]|nr:hypothetical protein [Flavobacteriales bacterium]